MYLALLDMLYLHVATHSEIILATLYGAKPHKDGLCQIINIIILLLLW